MKELFILTPETPQLHQFDSKELAMIRLGEDPKEFDCFIMSEIKEEQI